MSKLVLVTISIAAWCLMAPAVIKGGGPQRRAAYGPVVSAYLTGLAEELNELEYQLRNREIGYSDYERAKQRLTIMRRQVERLAAQSGADVVPELQILTDDELGELGAGERLDPNRLRVGALSGGQWRLIGIERGRMRYFIFNRLPQNQGSGVVPDRRSGRKYNPQEVIETIVVRDRPLKPAASPASSNAGLSPTLADQPDAEPSTGTLSAEAAVSSNRFRPPRILQVFLPRYTDKARNNGVFGELVVRALFQSNGQVRNVKVEKGLGSGLDQQALDAVKKMEFEPAQFDGKIVSASMQVIFFFQAGKIAFFIKPVASQP